MQVNEAISTMSDDTIRILGISGSLRRGSYSTMALRGLQEAVRQRAQVQIHSLEEIPLYNADLDGDIKPPAVVSLKAAIRECSGMVLVSPEYNYGMPGVLKNALDWASRPAYASVLKGKPVLAMTTSPGIGGGVRAHTQIRQTLAGTLSRLVAAPEVLVAAVNTKVDGHRLTDATSLKFMTEAFDLLLAEIRSG
jgi:chromate reductase, NAD(P)H dehydrogenase (quinone)